MSNYFTPQGHQKFVDEVNSLVKEERPEILKVIAWAAGNGDRSENADYLYGRKRLREIDRRIRFLNKRLDKAIIVDPEKIKSDVIRFGATVLIEDEQEDEKEYILVGPDEINPQKGKISFLSPIGKALMGKEEGDEVLISTPSKKQVFVILSVRYQKII